MKFLRLQPLVSLAWSVTDEFGNFHYTHNPDGADAEYFRSDVVQPGLQRSFRDFLYVLGRTLSYQKFLQQVVGKLKSS